MSFRVTGALLTTALLAASALEAGAAPATVPAPTPTVLTVRSGATAPAAIETQFSYSN